ncbi:hypothetical protein JZ751_010889 [Albula glossodonta]|uniref:Uncharacterized protein n=1 Tax=Albula glossodonta TaxID=121402 RepID=A0A8T2NXZ3_9TELE|nr:hypothetical protein JZ751_010889 [Albula glossodonta]
MERKEEGGKGGRGSKQTGRTGGRSLWQLSVAAGGAVSPDSVKQKRGMSMQPLLGNSRELRAHLVEQMSCMGQYGSPACPSVRKHVNDLYEDLRDGHNLISLLEVLSGESLASPEEEHETGDDVSSLYQI